MNDRPFSIEEAASLLDLTSAEVRSFARAALEPPPEGGGEAGFGFRDLVVLRMAAGLRRARVPKRRIARALAVLRRTDGEVAGLHLEALGDHVVVRDGEVVWRADSGQIDLGFSGAAGASSGPGPGALPAEAPRPQATTAAIPGLRSERGGNQSEAPDFEACLTRAREAEADEPEAALYWYRRALEADADQWEAHAGLGFLLQQQGRPAEAVESYRRASELEPDPTVAFNLGVALDDLGRADEAEAAYLGALELDPELADAHFNLSCLCERRGDRAGALRFMIAYRESTSPS